MMTQQEKKEENISILKGSELLFDTGLCANVNPFSTIYFYSKTETQQFINKECQPLIILSATNNFQMGLFKDIKCHTVI